jgi:hypothetical protein
MDCSSFYSGQAELGTLYWDVGVGSQQRLNREVYLFGLSTGLMGKSHL